MDKRNLKIYAGISGQSFQSPDNSRRAFLKKAVAATVAIAGSDLFAISHEKLPYDTEKSAETPWYRRVTRWGQTNITEKDPANYDIEWWRKQWKTTDIQGVIINAGGIVAYYPSKIPLHHQALYLEGHDIFGDLCYAAHEDGLAVFARMDSNRAHEDFYIAHPGWFAVDSAGKPIKAGDLYITCVNGPYYNEHIPAILTEISELYHPEGFTDNSWSGLGRETICYCENCNKSFHDKTGRQLPVTRNWDDQGYREWIRWNYDRRLEIWEMNNRVTKKAGGQNCIWSGMNSGTIRSQSGSFRDFKEICRRADIIMLDSQARSDAGGFQQNSDTGKLIHGMLGWDKLIPESMAMYQAGRPTFRLAAKPAQEARMWMIEGMAGGIQPWWHYVGAYHEDRRMYRTPGPVFKWHRANEEFLINRKPFATVGVLWSQQNMDFYGRDEAESMVDLPWRGITQALIRSRIPYLPVNAGQISRYSDQLSVLILPNLGIVTDEQAVSIREFVDRGGSLFATGESSLFDEWGDRRPDYALGDLFGVHVNNKINIGHGSAFRESSGETYHTYLRLVPELRRTIDGPKTGNEPQVNGARHRVLKGFNETDILSFGGLLEPLETDPGTNVIMTYIPQFPIYPPETAWMREPVTDIPGLILNGNKSGGRVAFMPADIDRQFGRYNLPDHGDLIANLVRWAANENIPISVECAGLLDFNIYLQPGRLILHIVNLTSAGTWRQPVDEYIPVGPVKVSLKVPESVKGGTLRCLVSGKSYPVSIEKNRTDFILDSISDHEVVVIG